MLFEYLDGVESFVHTSLRHREGFSQFTAEKKLSSAEVLQMLEDFASEKRMANARDFLMLVEYMRHCTITEFNDLKKFGQNEMTL